MALDSTALASLILLMVIFSYTKVHICLEKVLSKFGGLYGPIYSILQPFQVILVELSLKENGIMKMEEKPAKKGCKINLKVQKTSSLARNKLYE